MIMRVKYCGKWRNVIGITVDKHGRECYKLQCLDNKLCYQVVWVKDTAITEQKESKKVKPKKPHSHRRLTDEEKQEIIIMWESGKYYQKEIVEKFRTSVATLRKVVYENRIRSKAY